ncbi:response regulator transcription factor [Paenibacillus sp. GCM10023252]|uniref:response regulator transcription factor n=1 Tax=Paenibacillus sp. GCM10023252 TaxID=3252649 RepID=UPI003617B48C
MKKILIIEDEPAIAELQKDYLKLNGFEVDISGDGDEGLRLALTSSYDLIVLDLMLPGIDGYEICKQIREDKEVPILIVSARSEEIDKIRGLGVGADDYMTKPFSPSELVARVKAHTDRYERLLGKAGKSGSNGKSGQSNEWIRIQSLAIDLTSRRAYLAERELVFTAKEFDLLAFLAQHPNRVFSKEALFEKIWGLDALGDHATVTVHIRRLREKIEEDPSNPVYIETVWGNGYRFTE